MTSTATCFTWRDIRKWSLTTVSYNGTGVRQVHVCSTSIAFPISVLQAKLFFFAVTKNRIGHGPRCRHSRSRRAIHRCSNDGAASIPKSGLEIKNRCTQGTVNRENPASIRKSGPEIKNRCTQEGVNGENPASIPKSGLEIKNRCTLEEESGQETLEGVKTDNVFIQWNGSAASSRMQYFLRDHLGSVRVIAEDRHTVISRTDYLPFGVRMSGDGLTGANSTARSSFFGFSGKENEMWGGLNTADGDITPHWLKGERYQHFGARAYDPVSCIFMQVDPMAEKYYGMTPYGYCAGNPVMMVDPDGEIPFIANLVAGVISASIDFGAQVVVKMADSNDFSFDSFVKAVKDVDYLDVAISGIEGALTMGASNAKKFAVKGAAIVASSVVDVKINDGVTINDAPSVVLQSVVGTVTDGIGAGVKVNLPSKSANQAVKAARASAHAQGKGLPSSEAKATASKARKEIANKKEISAGIQAGTEGLLGTAIGTYVNENL